MMLSLRISELPTKTSKSHPADETTKNAQLLIQAGFVHKEMAGVYAYLPLGLQVVENIKQIVREEMNSIGGQEIIMTSLQRKELWQKTDRWDDQKVDVWFKSQLKNGTEVGLAWSHEEPITEMMKQYLQSYKDLPAYVYQFQTKLRNELRAKSGIMRGREFVMKDLYSYSVDEQAHEEFYQRVSDAYMRVFSRVGLGEDTYFTYASGGAFTEFSHEFQTVTAAGEDTIYVDRQKKVAINQEVYGGDLIKKLGLNSEALEKVSASEVGNIFNFGGTKSEQLGLYFTDANGAQKPVILGSYGIGITRLMGVIAEHFADDKGLVWPSQVAPSRVYLVCIGQNQDVKKKAEELFETFQNEGVSVLYDDREVRPGEKFADADLIGLPYRVVVSEAGLQNNTYELKLRTKDEVVHLNKEKLIETISQK